MKCWEFTILLRCLTCNISGITIFGLQYTQTTKKGYDYIGIWENVSMKIKLLCVENYDKEKM